MSELAQRIEAWLFASPEPVGIGELAHTFAVSRQAVEVAIADISQSLVGHGIVLVQHGHLVQLSTSRETSDVVRGQLRKHAHEPLSAAALEVLAIIAYRGPIARSAVEWQRGVNSHWTIRQLVRRGLVKRIEKEGAVQYDITIECLKALGVKQREELPQYPRLRSLPKRQPAIIAGESKS